jgi:hypothetical protein
MSALSLSHATYRKYVRAMRRMRKVAHADAHDPVWAARMHRHANAYRDTAIKARRDYYRLLDHLYTHGGRYTIARFRWAQARARMVAERGTVRARRNAVKGVLRAMSDALQMRSEDHHLASEDTEVFNTFRLADKLQEIVR